MKSEIIISTCIHHGEVEFRKSNRNDRKDNSYYLKCIPCQNERHKKTRIKNKKDFIAYKGSCCEICNKTYEWYQYNFHHLNPSTKDFDVSKKATRKLVKIKKVLSLSSIKI